MFIVKVRDSLRPHAPAASSRLVLLDLDRWKPCVIRYAALEDARKLVNRQLSGSKKTPELIRDFRIFEQNGRKLRLIEEIKGE